MNAEPPRGGNLRSIGLSLMDLFTDAAQLNINNFSYSSYKQKHIHGSICDKSCGKAYYFYVNEKKKKGLTFMKWSITVQLLELSY